MGEGLMLSFNLDEPFKLPAGKNLLVSVRKEGFGKKGFFPALFKQYNNDWEGAMRSLLYEGTQDYTFADDGGCKIFPVVPVLHMAIEKDGVGIGEIVLGDKVWFDADSNNLVWNGVEAASVAVYDFSGRLVANQKVAKGAQEVALNLAEGLYIVKVQAVDGEIYSNKIRVVR